VTARFVAQTAQRVLATDTSDPSFAAAAAALDGGTRVLALAAASFAAFDGDVDVDVDASDAEATALGVARAAGSSLAACVCSPKVPDGVVGNAALALGDLARLDRVSASLESRAGPAGAGRRRGARAPAPRRKTPPSRARGWRGARRTWRRSRSTTGSSSSTHTSSREDRDEEDKERRTKSLLRTFVESTFCT
jgi:hypothetical protein